MRLNRDRRRISSRPQTSLQPGAPRLHSLRPRRALNADNHTESLSPEAGTHTHSQSPALPATPTANPSRAGLPVGELSTVLVLNPEAGGSLPQHAAPRPPSPGLPASPASPASCLRPALPLPPPLCCPDPDLPTHISTAAGARPPCPAGKLRPVKQRSRSVAGPTPGLVQPEPWGPSPPDPTPEPGASGHDLLPRCFADAVLFTSRRSGRPRVGQASRHHFSCGVCSLRVSESQNLSQNTLGLFIVILFAVMVCDR